MAILILLLTASGIYVVIAYLLPAFKQQRGSGTGVVIPSHEPSTSGFALWLLLVLATCPWIMASILGDPLPAELQATREGTAANMVLFTPTGKPGVFPVNTPTPTFTMIVVSPTPPIPTSISRPSPTPRPAVMGVALRDLKVYSCPGKDVKFATTLTIASGKQFRILGWNESDGAKWYLVEDDGIGPQQWVAGSVSVSPPNYSDYIERATCRVAR
jgi:hypothetical protein